MLPRTRSISRVNGAKVGALRASRFQRMYWSVGAMATTTISPKIAIFNQNNRLEM